MAAVGPRGGCDRQSRDVTGCGEHRVQPIESTLVEERPRPRFAMRAGALFGCESNTGLFARQAVIQFLSRDADFVVFGRADESWAANLRQTTFQGVILRQPHVRQRAVDSMHPHAATETPPRRRVPHSPAQD